MSDILSTVLLLIQLLVDCVPLRLEPLSCCLRRLQVHDSCSDGALLSFQKQCLAIELPPGLMGRPRLLVGFVFTIGFPICKVFSFSSSICLLLHTHAKRESCLEKKCENIFSRLPCHSSSLKIPRLTLTTIKCKVKFAKNLKFRNKNNLMNEDEVRSYFIIR